MFDRYEVNQAAPYPQTVNKKVTITENRAPTDKSVELLGEMQQKAIESLLGRMKLESNVLKSIGMQAFLTAYKSGVCFIYEFKLNEEDINGKIIFDEFEFEELSIDDIFIKIREAIAKDITHRIMLAVCSDPISKKSLQSIFKNKL